jgi:rSAM/selenodomain-associated transferase 2/rSAM/selenodomain-associated transferase 1
MAPNHRERLIVFTRYPEPGRTKTRLIQHLGAEGAAELQRSMTEHIVPQIRNLTATRSVSIEIRYEGGNQQIMEAWLGSDYIYSPQGKGDLDRRMGRAFEAAFGNGVAAALIIGSDIPGISSEILHQAFNALQNDDLVLGPANDGGYYLIGLKQSTFNRALPQLMTNISWGSASVLDQTVRIAERMGLKYALLEKLTDVDRLEDLTVWQQAGGICCSAVTDPRPISVIIPALNEADYILDTLKHIQSGENLEIIVVDGGSTDNTVQLAKDTGAIVIQTPTGRARQMNAGAAAASADLLLFVHADTRLPKKFDVHIRQAMDGAGIAAGAFELRVDSPISTFRVIERLANWRSRRKQMPYGDQAIFVSASLFQEIGGFRHISIMEDFDLMRRLVKRGRIITLPVAVYTSPRRWLKAGIYKIWFINQIVIIAYLLGVPPVKIGRLYNRLSGLKDK